MTDLEGGHRADKSSHGFQSGETKRIVYFRNRILLNVKVANLCSYPFQNKWKILNCKP